ncbi:MAG: flagellar assembly protein FliW [Nitrospiraceae bacterium]|nr:flagellar assembly protein FliW [Nitrospiraceae bacterium]
MKCTSSRFGTFEIDENTILTFPAGLLGFPEQQRYVMLDHDTEAPFKWLQSLDEPGLAFVIIDPLLFDAGYRVAYTDDALSEVGGGEAEDMTVAVILTIPSEDPGRITANLRGPLLLNTRTRLCKQLVLSDDVPTRYPLFPVPAPDGDSNQDPEKQPLTTACRA